MTVKELKKMLDGYKDETEIVTVQWNGRNTILRAFQFCCNTEHQEKVNQLWVSTEGFPVQVI